MGFERILGEVNFPDDNLQDWLDAEIDPFEVFGPEDFWTRIIETAQQEGELTEDPPQGVKELFDSVELSSGKLKFKIVGDTLYIDGVFDDETEDAYLVEAFKVAAAFGKAAEFGARGELTFSDGYHEIESNMGGSLEVTVQVANGKAATVGGGDEDEDD